MTKAEREDYERRCVGTWPEYNGGNLYEVMHPDHRDPIIVRAPDHNSAIVTAATYWHEKWTAIRFYAYCNVRRLT